ncbi:thiopurine S-methyltransferase [Lysobacter sp. F6437]|uniref:thiopurine S-methyltransferase n=1 Tax=Lysobacter sp. F6437 TaxID=3459296 RepID=UPI00403D6FEA
MHPDYWHARWNEGRTGFNQPDGNPLLQRHWAALDLPAGSQVFVPLAGKSPDLLWLAARGHRVLAVELSPLAIAEFFAGTGTEPSVTRSRYGTHHRAGDIEMICGDVFDLDRQALSDCTAFYDRAALIALPPPLRQRYVNEVYAALPRACRGLLVSLEYPPQEMEGPPFAVDEAEIRKLYESDWSVETLERQDILANQPAFQAQGLTTMNNVAYALQRS